MSGSQIDQRGQIHRRRGGYPSRPFNPPPSPPPPPTGQNGGNKNFVWIATAVIALVLVMMYLVIGRPQTPQGPTPTPPEGPAYSVAPTSIGTLSNDQGSVTPTVLLPSPNQSSSSGNTNGEPTGKIVFTCQIYKDATRDQICLMNADGSNWHRLTQADNSENYYPSLSPDGQSVVYSSNQGGAPEIYEMNLLSGQTNQLTQGFSDVDAPAISPDGRFIAFNNNSGVYSEIWIMNRDGSNSHVLYSTQEDSKDPSWSPDGSKILFAVGGIDDKHLYMINVDGSDVHLVSNTFTTRGRSGWSPLGNLIASYSGQGWNRVIYTMGINGSNLLPINTGGTALAPSFSPDGQWIAFTGYRDHPEQDNGCEIYIMRVNGSDIRRLTNNDYCSWQPRWGL